MKFEIYCDEAHPDIFTGAKPPAQFLMIGSLWLPADLRDEIKQRVQYLREQYRAWGEIKWSKVSPNRADFYLALVDLFLAYGDELRFRCIAVDRAQVNLELHGNDGELGFYKFYYQLLHHWILDFNEYRIFCDAKSNRDPKRLLVLQRCLTRANLTSEITNFGHAFYESSARDGRKDVFSPVRAQRIDWIKATLENPDADLFQGWDKRARQYDGTRRVAVVYEDFVVVVAIGLTKARVLKANFVTCYQADNSINKIRRSPAWSRLDCLRQLGLGP